MKPVAGCPRPFEVQGSPGGTIMHVATAFALGLATVFALAACNALDDDPADDESVSEDEPEGSDEVAQTPDFAVDTVQTSSCWVTLRSCEQTNQGTEFDCSCTSGCSSTRCNNACTNLH